MTDTTTTAPAATTASHLDLTPQESEAGLISSSQQLVGLVEYDESTAGSRDRLGRARFVVGNATQAAQ